MRDRRPPSPCPPDEGRAGSLVAPDRTASFLFGAYGSRSTSPRRAGCDRWSRWGAVVQGHVLGVTLARERVLLSARPARASDQLPLVVVMVLFTVGGLGLLFDF